MRFYLLPFILLFSLSSLAEYRAFRLKISKRPPTISSPAAAMPSSTSEAQGALGENTPPSTDAGASREIISTLDPDQYRGYYTVKDDEVITYTETWMCPGRTGHFKDICPAPSSRTPASESTPETQPATSSETPASP